MEEHESLPPISHSHKLNMKSPSIEHPLRGLQATELTKVSDAVKVSTTLVHTCLAADLDRISMPTRFYPSAESTSRSLLRRS
jgi:hypothetical protein